MAVVAYCVKCKAKKEMVDPQEGVTKNGRIITKGTCPDCGTKMSLIGGVAKKQAFFKALNRKHYKAGFFEPCFHIHHETRRLCNSQGFFVLCDKGDKWIGRLSHSFSQRDKRPVHLSRNDRLTPPCLFVKREPQQVERSSEIQCKLLCLNTGQLLLCSVCLTLNEKPANEKPAAHTCDGF